MNVIIHCRDMFVVRFRQSWRVAPRFSVVMCKPVLKGIWYNSCRHRMCPQCGWLQVTRWLLHQKARLLACDHYHVIFTIPHELA
jgi:hypothetical protein